MTTLISSDLGSVAERNRATVLSLLKFAMQGLVEDALALVDENYVEHNRTIGTGRADLETYLHALSSERAPLDVQIRRTVAEGNHVVVHMETKWGPGRPDTVAIDIFELHDGLITEHWDAVQELPRVS
jgi:predicted SnoaL-like aldol condensation-catalyzing enzyme